MRHSSNVHIPLFRMCVSVVLVDFFFFLINVTSTDDCHHLLDTFIYGDDLVPRISLGALEELKLIMAHFLQEGGEKYIVSMLSLKGKEKNPPRSILESKYGNRNEGSK